MFSLLESCLGLEIDATKREVRFRHPVLPPALEWVRISNLTIPDARVDVRLDRSRDDVGVTITGREGTVDVVVVK